MPGFRISLLVPFAALALSACASGPSPEQTVVAAPQPVLPPAFAPSELVGRYGLAAYHKAEDEARTEAAARGQCKQPYIISMGPSGGVMMHLADQARAEELRLKGAPGGKTFIGPAGDAGGAQDREVLSFNGRVLVTKFVDPEVHGRYGNMVYVRCGPEGEQRRPAAKPRTPPRPRPT